MMMMMRVALLVLAHTSVCSGILPEIVNSGISHILEDNSVLGQNELDRVFVEVEQLPGDPQQKPDDAFHQKNESVSPHPNDLPSSHHNETASDKVSTSESVDTSVNQEETNNITTSEQSSNLGNNIDDGCIIDEDCGKGSYCPSDIKNSKCLPCKAIDVPCTKDQECCGEQLCLWGQCSQNATKGEAGSTCHYQADCKPDLCCAFHKALLFPICSAKPIERERCFSASNHLMALLSWDVPDEGPKKHCPCAGELHCQHLGRGSMCLKGEDSSEEDLTDSLYSEIDYII
ncbi:dickkopf-related protein 3a [Tautogolabrus adspersus]